MSGKHTDSGLDRRTQSISALMVMVMFVLLVQLWLVTIALEEYLAAQADLLWPTFIASLCCLAINLGLLKYLYGIDRRRE